MAQQFIDGSRLAQRTSGAITNNNFTELYGRQLLVGGDAQVAAGSFVVPAGYTIEHIIYNNNSANAVTGGLKFGTTAGGTDVVAAQAVGANAKGSIGAGILLRFFSKSAPQTIYFDAVTAWNSANVDVKVVLRKVY